MLPVEIAMAEKNCRIKQVQAIKDKAIPFLKINVEELGYRIDNMH